MVQVVCGVSYYGCIASNGDLGAVAEVSGGSRGQLDAVSCNATDTIEHLDFTPPCDSKEHERSGIEVPAEFHVIARGCACVPSQRLWCGDCVRSDRFNAEIWSQTRPCEVCGVCSPLPQVIHAEPLR